MAPPVRLVSRVLLAAAVTTAACSRNPATGRVQVLLISESQEIELGRDGDQQIVAEIGEYDETPTASAVVKEVGQELAAQSERPQLPWSFRILDDSGINAFALPGGFVYITRGLVAHLNSEDELAAVLGHEIGHVAARHGAVQMRKTAVARNTVGLFRVVDPNLRHIGGIAARTAQLALLSYSRSDENQADDLSVRYVRRTGYDPNAVTEVFHVLSAETHAHPGARVPTWLSSHPEPEARAQRISAELRAAGIPDARPAVDPEFLAKIEGVVIGEDPRQGYFLGRTFVYPRTGFSIDLPQDWEAAHDGDRVLTMTAEKDALLMLAPAEDATAKEGLEAFFGDAQVHRGEGWSGRVGGFVVESAAFAVGEGEGRLPGLVAFVDYTSGVYAMVAVGPEAKWAELSDTVAATFGSFRQISDARLRDVPPLRVALTTVKAPTTLADLEAARPSAVSLDEVARLNHVAPDEPLDAGRVVKQVTGFNVEQLGK